MEQIQVGCVEMVSKEVTMQVVDALRENTVQAQTKSKELTNKFQTLAGAVEEAHKV
jgi:hypothetical protein